MYWNYKYQIFHDNIINISEKHISSSWNMSFKKIISECNKLKALLKVLLDKQNCTACNMFICCTLIYSMFYNVLWFLTKLFMSFLYTLTKSYLFYLRVVAAAETLTHGNEMHFNYWQTLCSYSHQKKTWKI